MNPNESLISVFSNGLAKIPEAAITIDDLMVHIATDQHKAKIERIRGLIANGDSDAASSLKRNLTSFSISGHVTEGGRGQAMQEGRFVHSGWLQIDIDGAGLGDRSPEEARALLGNDKHVAMAFISPSGNGAKAIARIPVCKTKEEHVVAFQSADQYFADTYGLRIDQSTKDPVRLMFASWDPSALGQDPAACKILPIRQAPPPPPPPPPKKPSSKNGGSYDELTPATVREMLAAIPPRQVHDDWLRIASAVWDAIGEAEGTAALCQWSPEQRAGEYAYKFQHRLTKVRAGTLVKIAQDHGWSHPCSVRHKVKKLAAADPITSDEMPNLTVFDESDAGNAQRLFAAAGGGFHHIAESGKWILWNGSRWATDNTGGMTRLHLAVMDSTAHQAINMQSRQAGDALAKYALLCRNASKVRSTIDMLKDVAGVTVSTVALDADPWMIGTPDGMIDLKTGRPITPEPSKLITKAIGTRYDENATCPTWEKFLNTVTAGDVELITFLQCAVGYTLTGSNSEQCLFFLHGSGGNGKGVFSETIKRLIGDYGQTAPESLFTKDRNQSATNDQARLCGCRMAIAAELEEGASLAESRIKALTGGDTITARFLHREFFDFLPTHHFWISGNHKPAVSGNDIGIWRRIRLVPFTVAISAEERDPDLAGKLAGELPGILNWALEGCLRWQREGLRTPRCVSQATERYREEEDIIGQFLAECTVEDRDDRTLQSTLYEAYQAWAERVGIKRPDTAKTFNRKLEERGMHRGKSHGARFWECITLI